MARSGTSRPGSASSVRVVCLCLNLQRAARATARRFDEAFRPLGLTSGQFSLLTAIDRSSSPTIGRIASVLAMDRTTLTANLKPLERRGLVAVTIDEADRRSRRLALTREGRSLFGTAVPVWKRTHAAVESLIGTAEAARLRDDLLALS